jgi:hypothetical protein
MSILPNKEALQIVELTVQDDYLDGPALDTFDRYDCIFATILQ